MNPNEAKKKILVVEDDLYLREIYLDTLNGAGYDVDAAVDGDEGMNKIKRGGWDLVLLDIILPKVDGITVMSSLKEAGFKANFPIVFLSNIDNVEEMKKALLLGSGYLVKSSMTPEDLLKEVKLYLSQDLKSAPTKQNS